MWVTLSDAGEKSGYKIRNKNCPVDFARGKLSVYISRALLRCLLAQEVRLQWVEDETGNKELELTSGYPSRKKLR